MSNQILTYSLIFGICILCQKFAITKQEEITYAGIVNPPSFYKIIIFDKVNDTRSRCVGLFKHVDRKIRIFNDQSKPDQVIGLYLFKYKKGIILESLKECFVHFYSVETNEGGEFEIEMPSEVGDKINVHIFPLDDQRNLVESKKEPGTFLQNRLKRNNWKQFGSQNKDTLFIFFYKVLVQVVQKSLHNWFHQDTVPSKEDTYLIKTSFNELTKKVGAYCTNRYEVTTFEKEMLNTFGKVFYACLPDENIQSLQPAGVDDIPKGKDDLYAKLAQIDGMGTLVEEFCKFLVDKKKMENAYPTTEQHMLKLSLKLQIFCHNYFDQEFLTRNRVTGEVMPYQPYVKQKN